MFRLISVSCVGIVLCQCCNLQVKSTMTEKVKSLKWSDLPKELWPVIGKRLESAVDILRFRSVCKPWRSAIPPSNSRISFPGFPRKVTTPFGKRLLSQATIFRLEFYDCTESPTVYSKGWLIAVNEFGSGQLRLLNPFTNRPLDFQISPKVLDLMNFRIIELTKAYHLDYHYRYHKNIKTILFPNSASKKTMMFAVYKEGKLGFSTTGDEKWTLLDDKNFYYDDIIVYKEQLYVVDKGGTISWVDPNSLKLVQFSPPLCGVGKKKQLVVSCGSLYVVDFHDDGEPINMKVYRLDEEWGTWEDVKHLGNRLFVLGKDCNFSLSARDFYDCEENCIYFCDEDRACVFSLATSKFKSAKVFWPSPTLFHSKYFSSAQDDVLL
ncbi:hypothetical protein L6164_012731 [Bauhinia variegata]|uniref:Uncharacterized protein n=1 Tax=Bauhinia variegata TaxID=167791 RepID=A0ACB9P9Y7_BAUVA|nr:hypothetical protein L6164_012731 [Bauhinia variegata]